MFVTSGQFNSYTREAGAGGLSIAVEGPSKAEIDFQDRKDGSCGVSYTCTEPGEYLASVKFNDQHIPDSPFKVHIAPSSGDARKLTVDSLQDQNLQVGGAYRRLLPVVLSQTDTAHVRARCEVLKSVV